jgi:hypothetical protein
MKTVLRMIGEEDEKSGLLSPHDPDAWKRRIFQTVVMVGLSIQFTVYAIGRSRLHSQMCDGQILFLAELLKLAWSAVYTIPQRRIWCHDSRHALVPCVCFMVMNLLSLWAMRHVSATCAVVLLQTKLPMTVMWSRLLLGRTVSNMRNLLLLTVCCGTLGVAVDALQAPLSETGGGLPSRLAPIFALLCETCVSGFSSVYMERMFQTSDIWVRNVQLSVFGAIAYALSTTISYLRSAPCTWEASSMDASGLTLSCISAAGGLLVALTLKFVGGIEKTMVTLSSVVSTGVVECMVSRRLPSMHFLLHGITATLAVVGYALQR